MSKENRDFDLDKRLIGFAVRVIRAAESFIAQQNNRKLHNSKFLVRYSRLTSLGQRPSVPLEYHLAAAEDPGVLIAFSSSSITPWKSGSLYPFWSIGRAPLMAVSAASRMVCGVELAAGE